MMLDFKSFKNELNESQWMYHGSVHDFDIPTPDRNDYMIDRAIGTHFSSDPTLADKFKSGLYGKSSDSGIRLKTRSPARSKLEKVPQENHSDQHAIMAHVGHTVFSHPEGKELFLDYVKRNRRVDDNQAEELYHRLSTGQSVNDKSKFSTGASSATSFRSYVNDYGGLNINDTLRSNIVHKFLDIMKERGIVGLTYQNTAPMEIKDVRSPKSYILFHPEEHEHPYIKE